MCHLAIPRKWTKNTSSVSIWWILSSVVGVVLSFLSGIFSLPVFLLCTEGAAGGVLPPIHSSRWHRERQVHANPYPAHLIVPELIIKPASEPELTWLVLEGIGKGKLPRAWRSHRVTLTYLLFTLKCYFASWGNRKQLSLGSESGCIWIYKPVLGCDVL